MYKQQEDRVSRSKRASDRSMQVSDLEFVEELTNLELEIVAGGQALPTPKTGINSLDNVLSGLRSRAEGDFKRRFPDLAKLIFS